MRRNLLTTRWMLTIALAVAGVTGLTSAGLIPEITIQREDFDVPFALSPRDWASAVNPGATLSVQPGRLQLGTEIDAGGSGFVEVWGLKQAVASSVLPYVFRSRVAAYFDHALYGNLQPRGLAAGHDRHNAIEFVSHMEGGVAQFVKCRTVRDGIATETIVSIAPNYVGDFNVYEIVVFADKVQFYVNGRRVATHISNIPAVPLNAYFSTSDGGAMNVPMNVDYVSLSRIVG